ncbi:MAG: RDD family protein [Acidobacteriota bacterium]
MYPSAVAPVADTYVPVCTNHPEVVDNLYLCGRCQKYFCRDCLVGFQGEWLCRACKRDVTRDLVAGVREGSELATLNQRFVAVFIDGLIFVGPYILMIALAFAEAVSDTVGGALMVGAFALAVFGRPLYEALMYQYADGQTLGKRAVGIRVIRLDEGPISAGQAWGRALGRLMLDSCAGMLNYIAAVFTKDRSALHDLLAKTKVVRVETFDREAYRAAGGQCPKCGAPWGTIESGTRTCHECGYVVELLAFRPPQRNDMTLRLSEAGPGETTPCANHDNNVATVTCDHCGLVMCDLCRTELPTRELCPQCFERLHAERKIAETRTDLIAYQSLVTTYLLLGLLVMPVAVVTGPLTMLFATKLREQRQSLGEPVGRYWMVAIFLAALELLGAIGIWLFLFVDGSAV